MLICVTDKTRKKFENAQRRHKPHKLRSSLTIILSMFTSNLSCSTVLRASAILAMLLDIPLVDDFLPMRHQNKTVVCVTEVRGRGGKYGGAAKHKQTCLSRSHLRMLESVSICSLISLPGSQLQVAQGGSQRTRAGEERQISCPWGGLPLTEDVNTLGTNIDSLLARNACV